MTRPTVFGMNGSAAMAGGEAGAEAILPPAEFDTKLWIISIETVTVHSDGRMVFKFKNGTEIEI